MKNSTVGKVGMTELADQYTFSCRPAMWKANHLKVVW